jgi:hypothetical protein
MHFSSPPVSKQPALRLVHSGLDRRVRAQTRRGIAKDLRSESRDPEGRQACFVRAHHRTPEEICLDRDEKIG